MSYASGAHKYIMKTLSQQFGLSPSKVEEVFNDERTFNIVADFLHGEEKVNKLVFFYQTRDTFTEDNEIIEASGASPFHARWPSQTHYALTGL